MRLNKGQTIMDKKFFIDRDKFLAVMKIALETYREQLPAGEPYDNAKKGIEEYDRVMRDIAYQMSN
jgi:hypothetical protein